MQLTIGVEVLVRGRVGRPWRARVIRVGPCWRNLDDEQGWLDGDSVIVQALERGKGWSTQPLQVAKHVCELVPVLRLVSTVEETL